MLPKVTGKQWERGRELLADGVADEVGNTDRDQRGGAGLMPKGSIPMVAAPALTAAALCVTTDSHQSIKTQNSGTEAGGVLG